MPVPSLTDLIQQLRNAHLLSEDQLAAVARDLAPVLPDVGSLLRDLVQRGWLKPEQANLLVQGRGRELAPPPRTVEGPEPTILDSGVRWRLAAILGGVFLLLIILVLAFGSGGKKARDPLDADPGGDNTPTRETAEWPEDLTTLSGVTESTRSGASFLGKNTKGREVVWVEGKFILNDVVVDKVVVRIGADKREYRSVGAVPNTHSAVALTLHELGRREVFGTWSR
jgi:hypothetical protein